MKCLIPGPNVKIFGRAVHSLSKIGNELYFEPLADSLAIRTVNSSRSAYACFTFSSSFFLQYVPTTIAQHTQGEEEEAVRCKITMKSCLSVFKSLATLEKTVDKCKIHLDMKEARLVFQLHCKHGIVKTHNLSFIECETLQAVFTKEFMPNVLTAQSRLFMDAVVNFQNNQEEISLSVDPHRVLIKNYVEDEPDPNKCIRSELVLNPDEFELYQAGVDTEVTFCLKELRAILAFSEPSNLALSAHFEGAGKPIVFSMNGDTGFQGDFVLATLAETNSQPSQQYSQARNTTQNISTAPTPRPANPRRPNVPKPAATERTIAPTNKLRSINSNDQPETQRSRSKSFESSKPSTSKENHASVINRDNEESKRSSSHSFPDDANQTSPVIPPCSERPQQKSTLLQQMDNDDETDDEDMLPSTPPAKKFKSLFFGMSQSTTSGSQAHDGKTPQVLAEDTDDED